MLRLTGFRTYREFVETTEPLERRLILKGIESWHEERQQSGGGGGGGPPGVSGL